MAFIPGEFIYRATFDFDVASVTSSITLWVKDTNENQADQSPGIAALLNGWAGTNIMTDLSQDATYRGVTVYNMESESAPKSVVIENPPIVGSIAEDVTPIQASVITTFETTGRGRSARGRVYLPGVPETDIIDGLVTSTARAKFATIWSTLTGVLGGTNLQHGVVSRVQDGVPRATLFFQPVTEYIVREYVGTQRRRTRGL